MKKVVAGRLPTYFQVGAQGVGRLHAETNHPVPKALGLLNPDAPPLQVEVSHSQATGLAGAQVASEQ